MKSRATTLTMMVLIAVASTAVAQGPDTIWTRTYGREDFDVGSSVRQTADGGYIVAGYTWLFGTGYEDDVYLIKTDASGDTLWTRTYGGAANDRGNSVQQTANGGYIVTGYTWSFGAGHSDVFLIKTNGYGGTLWTRTYGGADNDWGTSVQQTADGGYIVAGWTDSFSAGDRDVYLIKTNGSGITLWTRTYGGADDDGGNSVQQTADGGYIVTGYTWSFGAGHDYDVYLIKTDASGDTLWTRTYGGVDHDGGNSVQQTADGGYIVAGWTDSFGDWYVNVYLIKTDASGNTLWTRTYGGGGYDFGFSVQQTADGGYIVAGKTGSFGDWNGDVYLIKTDASGDTLWTRTYGGAEPDGGNSVQQTADGGYVVAGFTYSFGAGDEDVYLIRLDSETGFEDKNNQPLPRQLALNQNYPNPFNASTSISYSLPQAGDVAIDIYDLLGRKVQVLFEANQVAGEHQVLWDAGDLPSGIYFARLRVGSHSDVIRMTLLK